MNGGVTHIIIPADNIWTVDILHYQRSYTRQSAGRNKYIFFNVVCLKNLIANLTQT